MLSTLLCTDVLAIRCVNNFIFVGMGCGLYIFNANTHKLERKINCLYPSKIHGIVEGPNNTLTVFGGNFVCTYKVYEERGILIVKEENNKLELDDWIIAAKWFTYNGSNNLCVLLAHNNGCIYDTLGERCRISCEEKCILYCGSIFDNNGSVTILSGTVYQEILIWEINPIAPIEVSLVLHRLQGHNGVIFSIVYDPIMQLICSTSDDRTIRLWKITNVGNKETRINWKEVNIKLMTTMFGHTARIWRSIIRNKTLITIGEDSLMCIWSLDGKLLNKIYAHHGAAVWSIDVSSDNKSIFTGGADGAVHAWPLVTDHAQKTLLLPREHMHSQPKYVCYLKSGSLLIFSEDGTVFIFDRDHHNLQESLYLEKYSSYCVMEVSSCHSYVCLASRDGYVTMFKENESTADKKLQQVFENKVMESQVLSIHWLGTSRLVACGQNGILKIFNFTAKGFVTVELVRVLPYSRERWLTAATLYEGLLVCGDRTGNMYIFQLNQSNSIDTSNEIDVRETHSKPIQTFVKVHGKIGVQNFIVFNSKLVSAGRDGVLRFYELSKHKSTNVLCPLHKEKMPMDWISGNLNASDDILVLGFKEMEFIVYSMFHHRALLRVPCGGGHRSWDCMLLNDLITFLYIRKKQVYMFDFALSSLESPVLQTGFHTKEINCINPLSQDNHKNIFISGGEDGTLRVSRVLDTTVENNFTFRTLGTFDGHVSSLKFVVCLAMQANFLRNKHIIFSGGGRAQIKVWEIDTRDDEASSQNADIVCHDVASHMLYGCDSDRKKHWQQSNRSHVLQPETRYMDIAIYHSCTKLNNIFLFVACADGFIRIFLYNADTKHIELKVHARCTDRCITKVSVLTYDTKIIVLAMSTDGTARFLDFTDIVSRIVNCSEFDTKEFQDCENIFIAAFNLHQSGINSYDIKIIEKGDILLATGGDDNLFNLARFKAELVEGSNEICISLLCKWHTSSAHYAQITGLIFQNGNKVFTVGVDQQLIMYTFECSKESLSVKVMKKMITFVTDAKGLTSWNNLKGETVICVYGNGFELFIP